VRGAKMLDELAEARYRLGLERGNLDGAREILLGKTELRELEQRMGRRIVAEWIEIRDEVSELAVGVNDVEHAGGGAGRAAARSFACFLGDLGARDRHGGRSCGGRKCAGSSNGSRSRRASAGP